MPGLLPGADLTLPLIAGVVSALASQGNPVAYPTEYKTKLREDVSTDQIHISVLDVTGLVGKHLLVGEEIMRVTGVMSRVASIDILSGGSGCTNDGALFIASGTGTGTG